MNHPFHRFCFFLPALIGLLVACNPSPLPSPTPTVRPRQIQVTPLARLGQGTATGLAWSPDSTRLAVASSLGIDLYDRPQWELIHQLNNQVEGQQVVFAPDSQRLISWSEEGIRLWNVENGNLLRIFEGRGTQTTAIAVSPTPAQKDFFLATGSSGLVRLWRANAGLIVHSLRISDPENQITAATFSPDSTLLTVGTAKGGVYLWDVQDGIQLADIAVHRTTIATLAFSTDGTRLLTIATDGHVYLLDARQEHYGEPLAQLTAPIGPLTAAAVHPHNNLAVIGTADGAIAFSPDALCTDPARCWDDLSIIRQHQTSIIALSFSPDGRMLASLSQDSRIQLWEIDGCPGAECTIRPTKTLNGYRPPVNTVSMRPDGQVLVVGYEDGQLIMWQKVDMPEGWVPVQAILAHMGSVLDAAFAADGRRIVSSGDDNAVRVWRLNDDTPLYTLKGHAWPITDLAWSPDDQQIASASCDKTIKLWDGTNGQAMGALEHPACVRSLAFFPDGTWLASGADDGLVRVWDRTTGQTIQSWEAHEFPVWQVAWSPDGRLLASGDDKGTILVWSREAQTPIAKLKGGQGQITGLLFSTDGALLMAGSADRAVRIWQVDGSILLDTLNHESAVQDLTISSDGQVLVVGLRNGTVYLWQIKVQ